MKTRLLSLFIFLSVNSFSQITVYENDLVGVGDLMIKAFDPNANVSLGTTGPNQYWDFGSLQFPSFDNLFQVKTQEDVQQALDNFMETLAGEAGA